MPKFRTSATFLAALLLGIGSLLTGCRQLRPIPTRLQNQGNLYWNSNSFPLLVIIDSGLAEADIVQIEEAVQAWNLAVGELVFETSYRDFDYFDHDETIKPTNNNEIYFYSGELGLNPEGSIRLGLATRYFWPEEDGRIYSCTIRLDDGLIGDAWYVVALHELGHALGLNHDDTTRSIMFRHALNSQAVIEDSDIEYIKAML